MKPLSEQDHYEILEIARGTSAQEIGRAYQLARATYTGDSLASYSVLDSAEAEAIRERIELAYRVLSDAEARRDYDTSLPQAAAPVPEAPTPVPEPELAATLPQEPLPGIEAFEDLEVFEEEEGGDFDGARLRRSRLRRGMGLEDVARVTKVNPTYLRFLEEERFADLPARVYVRGFVGLYASMVGLDATTVTASYMRRYDQEGDAQPGRRFGRGG